MTDELDTGCSLYTYLSRYLSFEGSSAHLSTVRYLNCIQITKTTISRSALLEETRTERGREGTM